MNISSSIKSIVSLKSYESFKALDAIYENLDEEDRTTLKTYQNSVKFQLEKKQIMDKNNRKRP